MRRPIVAANWKMNTTLTEGVNLVKGMLVDLLTFNHIDKIIFPPFTSLYLIKQIIEGTSIKLGAQNMHFEPKGAFTGEISPLMIKDLCTHVIIGHSERRRLFFENDEILKRKLISALNHSLAPIFCIGEDAEQYDSGNTYSILKSQIQNTLSDVRPSSIIIAYEPIWAIGTGKPATAKMANETIKYIRIVLSELWGEDISKEIRILYGGSVTKNNILELSQESEIDGVLVGGASLNKDEFISICRTMNDIKSTS